MRDRLASIRPPRLVACFCLPANLISRIACTLISFWPVSQPHIDFWNIMSVWGWRALFWTQFCNTLVAFVCWCLLFVLCPNSFGLKWFGELRELLIISEMWFLIWASWFFCFFLLYVLTLCFPTLIPICLTFLFPSFYFPCCFSYLMCLRCLALCVETSGYEMAGWVSETLVSVWQSLWYISRPLPCIIDSLSLITVSSVTDEPLLPAAPALQGVSGSQSLGEAQLWKTPRFCE